MIKRLRAQFIGVNMATVTVMLLVIFCLIFGFTRESLKQQSLSMMESIGQAPIQPFIPGEFREEIRLPYFVLQIDITGSITAVSGGYFDLSNPEFFTEALSLALESGEKSGILEQYHLRFLQVDSRTGLRFVFADISSEEATLNNLIRIFLLVGAAALGAFFALSFWLASRAVRPVEQAWLQQKQFLADASHELKTPLTVILTNAELLRDPDTPDHARLQFTDSILRMAGQMRSLVERLLTLSRMDNNGSNMVMEELDLTALVEERLLPFEPLYFERGLTLESDLTEQVHVSGSREHLAQVVDILLDNAMKYAISPGEVKVTLKKQGREWVLSVSNSAEALSKEELERIFERFYRVDKARARDGSCGLGLPIARSIVTEHGGRIRAESEKGTVTLSVTLRQWN